MLAKINRITKNNDFQLIYQKGKKVRSVFFILKFLENKIGVNRFGFIISQKVSKKAVERNRIKRILRDYARKKIIENKKKFDFVIVALPAVKEKKADEVRGEMEKIFKKIN